MEKKSVSIFILVKNIYVRFDVRYNLNMIFLLYKLINNKLLKIKCSLSMQK